MIIRDAPGITISILTVVAADITSITRIDVVLEEEREELGDLVAVEAVEDQTVPVVSVAAVRSLRLREGLHYPRPPEAVLIKRVPIHHLSQIDLIEAEGLGHPV
jgi:predicted subunit of tRNA(5-methylaminomethyl-2-thiouridylate) methyltransferase